MFTDRQLLRAAALLLSSACAFAFALSGCPGVLCDGTDANDDGLIDACPPFKSGPCNAVTDIFPTQCADAACHNPTDAIAGLDLVSPDVASRVVGQQASTADMCTGRLLVDPNAPEDSLLYSKLNDPPPCGVQMPFSKPELTEPEKQCVLDWIKTLGGGGSTTTAGGMGGTPGGGMGGTPPMGGMGGMGGAGGN